MNSTARADPFVRQNLTSSGRRICGVAAMIELGEAEWALVEDLFDPPGREGTPAADPRRQVVDAIPFLARTGCQVALPAGVLPAPGGSLAAAASVARERREGERAVLAYLFAGLRVEPA